MKDLSSQQLHRLIDDTRSDAALFFYTPLCGTCKLTERMLNIILEIRPNLPLYKVDINFAPEFVVKWKLESVPCIVLLSRGEPQQIVYRMQSVTHLYHLLSHLK